MALSRLLKELSYFGPIKCSFFCVYVPLNKIGGEFNCGAPTFPAVKG